ncbi:ion channel [Qipengyuania huizhouensis]|nr:ion channel [Qipengyuania huizhouensis]
MDYDYFALITVTTVGLGGIYPTDHLREIAGIASLTGFILIRCTAQYVYKTMSQQED